jgi:hypothetical protein
MLPPLIDLALNEAMWWGIRLDRTDRRIALGVDVLRLPPGPGGDGVARVSLVLVDVARFVVSYRLGRWDDDAAEVVPCAEDELPELLRGFGGQPVYGWEFFDIEKPSWVRWADRLCLDARWAPGPATHDLTLFQEQRRDGQDRHLDFRAWFERVELFDMDAHRLDLDEFAAGGKRWWDGFYAGDPRTQGFGMYPLKGTDD